MAKAIFREYTPDQMMLLPPSLDELVGKNHPVRLIKRVMDAVDISILTENYPGGGAPSYHPRMLLTVLVYAYMSNIYSSRKIEEALSQNIHFMWLAGMRTADHNTINRFRSGRLSGKLKEIFRQVVGMLNEGGMLSLKEIYTDGTKIEANANRYTFVWGKAAASSRERIKRQIDELWRYVEHVTGEELQDTEPLIFEEIDPETVKRTIEKMNEALSGKPVEKKIRQKLNYAEKQWPENLRKYEEQEKLLEGRRNYAKTDPSATFMRMKEDHMKNGQLKPGYNVQVSTNNQYIVNYTLHQTSTDTTTLRAHLDEHRRLYTRMPAIVTADAGYGSGENYQYLEDNGIDGYVKYSFFEKEQKRSWQAKHPFRQEALYYNEAGDYFICPMGQRMRFLSESCERTSTGFVRRVRKYAAQSCKGCPLRGVCHKGKQNRIVELDRDLRRHKERARVRLLSEEGIRHRKKRGTEVESVFAMIKHNHGFRRFGLRGMKKVEIETGLVALAHNLRKMSIKSSFPT